MSDNTVTLKIVVSGANSGNYSVKKDYTNFRIIHCEPYSKTTGAPGSARVRVAGLAPKHADCGWPNSVFIKIYATLPNPIPSAPPAGTAEVPVDGVAIGDGYFTARAPELLTSCSGSPTTRYVVFWAKWNSCNGTTPYYEVTQAPMPLDCSILPVV